MAFYNQGTFVPKNPQKYKGSGFPTYRSAWELTFMQVCDNHPNIIEWVSEGIEIPYQNPITGRWHRYIPDFIVYYLDKSGNKRAEIIEIKPFSQSVMEAARSKKDKEALIVNMAKWKFAKAFCSKNGLTFRVMTERDLYASRKR